MGATGSQTRAHAFDAANQYRWYRRLPSWLPPLWVAVVAVLLFLVWRWTLHKWGPEKGEHALTALAILIGGFWTLYQFVLRKAFESALRIDVRVVSKPQERDHLVYVEVALTNIGARRIKAPETLTEAEITDYEKSIRYPADLQIKRIVRKNPGFVGWWSKNQSGAAQDGTMLQVPNIPEHISLLYEYTRTDGRFDFFMEPSECCQLGTIFVLEEGHYAAKVVFVGSRASSAEFWSRIMYFHVPCDSAQAVV